ncbi:glucose-6-phosphate dehydrogenase [Pelomicrobium sp.]|jgi:glucose-6-phosphate 1-dehydrogenase|uniref:glucose-6-phosphate dehydrogenase n=1 Tax=Pelomicrobium sp. TaxID=2815319 RepID=UPI002FDD76FB
MIGGSPEPCSFVIFGATGHLATTKLLPALYQLEAEGRLHGDLRFFAFARRPWRRAQWLEHLERLLGERLGDEYRPQIFDRFADRFDYVVGDLNDPGAYTRLVQELGKARPGRCENLVFYLAVRPQDFATVIENLDRAGINRSHGRHRIVVEKPFGQDLDSARQLNALLHRHFDEEQIYRIDHYLGKETVQNLFVLRFANMLVEPVWNRSCVDHVQITVAETGGVGQRSGYYEGTGALRDMVQNHLLQLVAMVAMEPPATLDPEAVRDEKVKVLRSIRPIPPQSVDAYAVRGQYVRARVAGEAVPGYREEPGVDGASATETYAALKLYIDNWRWRDVPFYLRTGKRLPSALSLIAIRFKHPPQRLFGADATELEPNWIILSLQPEECVHLELQAKRPGMEMRTRVLRLNASYRQARASSLEPYKTLLLDVIEGDQSLFLRFDEIEWSWRGVEPVLRHWTGAQSGLIPYPAGSWGPEEAERLFDRPDQAWRNHL